MKDIEELVPYAERLVVPRLPPVYVSRAYSASLRADPEWIDALLRTLGCRVLADWQGVYDRAHLGRRSAVVTNATLENTQFWEVRTHVSCLRESDLEIVLRATYGI